MTDATADGAAGDHSAPRDVLVFRVRTVHCPLLGMTVDLFVRLASVALHL